MTDVLALIDGAIEDYETGRDAMRWTPEPEAARASDARSMLRRRLVSPTPTEHPAAEQMRRALNRAMTEIRDRPEVIAATLAGYEIETSLESTAGSHYVLRVRFPMPGRDPSNVEDRYVDMAFPILNPAQPRVVTE